MIRKLFKLMLLGYKEYQDPYYQGTAAQIAYYLMLSMIPTLLVLSQFLGLLDISLDFLSSWVKTYVEGDMAKALRYFLDYKATATTTNIMLIILAIWAASRIQYCLTRVTDYTYSGGTNLGIYWKDRIRAVFTLVITIVGMVLFIVAFLYAEIILRKVIESSFSDSIMELSIKTFSWILSGIIYFVMVSFNYYIIPTERRPMKEILPGSIFASIGMLVVTIVYAYYVSSAVTYDVVYGSLSSIVILMFWFYFIAWVLCIGIFINKAWQDIKAESI